MKRPLESDYKLEMSMMDHYAAVAAAAAGVGLPPLKRQPMIRVKNVSISDVYTHQIIFQRVYTWKATTAFSNLGNLIESFYQFSRTVDDGAVVGIDFESTGKDNVRRRRDDPLWDVRGDTMHMMTLKTTDFTATAFYDLCGRVLINPEDEKKFKIFLHTVTIAFEHVYLDTLRTMRAQHQLLSKQHPDETIMMNTGIFADFMSMVDGIHEMVFNGPVNGSPRPGLLLPPSPLQSSGVINPNSTPASNGSHMSPPSNIQQLHTLRDDHQLDHWLQTSFMAQPQQLSVEEEVRNVLETMNIFLPEIILDRFTATGATNTAAATASNAVPNNTAVGNTGLDIPDF